MVQEADLEILSCISPRISPFIKALILEGKVGVCFGKMRILDTLSGSASVSTVPANCDRFKLIIPYAGQSITWEVLFDCHHPEEPPDFIFGPEDEDFCPLLEELTSLCDWNPRDARSLVLAVTELVDKYREHHQMLISKNSRLQFEYSNLLKQTDVKPDDIEILVTRNEQGKLGNVRFLIKLSVDFSQVPTYLTKDYPGEDSAMLLLSFQSPESSRVAPELFLSPKVENALGGSSMLRIPSFPSNSTLADYLPNVSQLLKNKVDMVVQGHDKKKEYIAAFMSLFGRSVMEYDMETFSKISFLFEWHDFFFIVHIDVPLFFPKEQPVFVFQSIYHEQKGKPFTETHTDYPYSPRWSGTEMAERARSYILDNIGAFQKSSVLYGTF